MTATRREERIGGQRLTDIIFPAFQRSGYTPQSESIVGQMMQTAARREGHMKVLPSWLPTTERIVVNGKSIPVTQVAPEATVKRREAAWKLHLEGMSYAEIAEAQSKVFGEQSRHSVKGDIHWMRKRIAREEAQCKS